MVNLLLAKRDGNTGVVTLITTADDLREAPDHLPWGLEARIALVNVKDLDSYVFFFFSYIMQMALLRRLLEALRTTEDIVGVLLYRKANERFDGWSEDAVCPNRAHCERHATEIKYK